MQIYFGSAKLAITVNIWSIDKAPLPDDWYIHPNIIGIFCFELVDFLLLTSK